LLRPVGERAWSALVRPGRRFKEGTIIELEVDGIRVAAEVVGHTAEGGRLLELKTLEDRDRLASAGETPLPPYIKTPLEDESRYQTVYAEAGGSAAAPTAGLHFTHEILHAVQEKAIELAQITLHVGIDTFRPVRVDSLEAHRMHGEWYSIGESDAGRINSRRGRLVAAGTTTVRAIESAADESGKVSAVAGETRLFIYPGYRFRAVQGILTNFHLPKSTLLMMISAFAGRENVLAAYAEAVRARYRFYSFGDAMLIL
jgi:S-adenosylmethionine:tRNA ribosyltransferase-isomerase